MTASPQRPKNVLYIAENALSPIQGGGIVAYAVLNDLPPEQLLGFFEYRSITPAPEFAARFIWLGPRKRTWLTHFIAGFGARHPMAHGLAKASLDGALALFNRMYANADLEFVLKQVKARGFKPEFVYFSGLSLRFLQLAVLAAEHFQVPMAVLHMDDWMAVETRFMGVWGSRWRALITEQMQRAAALSLSSTTNSPRLARVVTEMTGHEHLPANNCCSDMMDFLPSPLPPPQENKIPVITYAGALNMHLQGETIVKALSGAVAELNAEGFPVHLYIYTPWEFAPLANSIAMPGAIFYKGQLSRKNLARAYWDSDFLLTTVTYRARDLLLFKHSLSTKLSEYLSVSKPVISAGHPDWHLHEYVQEHKCGWSLCFDENFKRAEIKEQLKAILASSQAERQEIGERNRKLWVESHDVTKMARGTRAAIGLPI